MITPSSNALISDLVAADVWLRYDTSLEAADKRTMFRAAIQIIKQGHITAGVLDAVTIARTVLIDAEPDWRAQTSGLELA